MGVKALSKSFFCNHLWLLGQLKDSLPQSRCWVILPCPNWGEARSMVGAKLLAQCLFL